MDSLQPVGKGEGAPDMYDVQLVLSCPTLTPKTVFLNRTKIFYAIDTARSEVIEFERCSVIKKRMDPGRFWYDPSRRKRKSFISWAEQVFKWTKKNFILVKDPHERYFGPEACKLYAKGQLKTWD